jgi:excisionase family DNA binding protein
VKPVSHLTASESRRHLRPAARLLPERYLTPNEVAHLLGVPVDTLYQWRYRGTGPPSFRVGRHLRYDPEAVAQWIQQLIEGTK